MIGFWFIAKRIFFFAFDNWRVVLPVAVFAAIAFWFLIHYGCSKPAPKLNQEEIIKSQQAIAANDRKTQIEILTNSEVREANIDANVAAGRNATINAIANSRAEWSQKSNEEIAAELERRARENQ